MSEQKSGLVQFRPGSLSVALNERGGSVGSTAKRDLERYYHLIDQCLAEVEFSLPEALVVAEILMTIPLDWRTIQFIGPIMEKTLKYERDLYVAKLASFLQKDYWESFPDLGIDVGDLIDVRALTNKLQNLTVCQTFAVYDAVERYSKLSDDDDLMPFAVDLDGIPWTVGNDAESEGVRICWRLISTNLWHPERGEVTRIRGTRWFSLVSHLIWNHRRGLSLGKEVADGAAGALSTKATDQQERT